MASAVSCCRICMKWRVADGIDDIEETDEERRRYEDVSVCCCCCWTSASAQLREDTMNDHRLYECGCGGSGGERAAAAADEDVVDDIEL